MRISVVIPAYQEAKRIPSTLSDIVVFARDHPGMIDEVVVCDDSSKDNTVEECLRFAEKLPLTMIRLAKNSGKWVAVHEGMVVARNDAVLLLDADGSASIFELERMKGMLGDAEKNKVAIFGTRFGDGALIIGKNGLRMMVSRGYRLYSRFFFWFATGRKSVNDMQCPWKLIWKSNIEYAVDGECLMKVKRFAGDIELACCIQSPIWNWPCVFIHKRGSKVPFSAIFDMAWETLRVSWRFRELRNHELEVAAKGKHLSVVTAEQNSMFGR